MKKLFMWQDQIVHRSPNGTYEVIQKSHNVFYCIEPRGEILKCVYLGFKKKHDPRKVKAKIYSLGIDCEVGWPRDSKWVSFPYESKLTGISWKDAAKLVADNLAWAEAEMKLRAG